MLLLLPSGDDEAAKKEFMNYVMFLWEENIYRRERRGF